MVKHADIKQRVLDSALKIAEEYSWEDVHLSDIAADLDISLHEIQQQYSQKDDLVEAWFDRADKAMLQLSANDLSRMEITDRLHKIIFTWLDVLAEHKSVTREMLWYKLEPLHLHLQLAGLLRISRTVQWVRELAGFDSRYIKRIFEESTLTSVYLFTFIHWLHDDSAQQTRTHNFLKRKLKCIDSCKSCFSNINPSKRKQNKSSQPAH